MAFKMPKSSLAEVDAALHGKRRLARLDPEEALRAAPSSSAPPDEAGVAGPAFSTRDAATPAQLEPAAPTSPSMAPAAPRPGAPSRAAKAGERVRISVTARYPAEGHSRTFDAIAAVYGLHQAMRIVVRKALDAYEASPGRLPTSATPPGYPAREGRLNSTRQIDGAVHAATRRIVDPLGLLPVRAVDTLLVTAALTAFFADSDNGGRV